MCMNQNLLTKAMEGKSINTTQHQHKHDSEVHRKQKYNRAVDLGTHGTGMSVR